MNDSADKWNTRYAESTSLAANRESGTAPDGNRAKQRQPAEVLTRFAHWLPDPTGRQQRVQALDLACGRAGNAEWLAGRGFHTTAWDISQVAIEDILERRPRLVDCAETRDVIEQPPEPESFDVIVVSRFLERAVCPAIAAALKPGGTLFYQTFTQGLTNPDYLLKPNELPALFGQLHIREYRDPEVNESGKAEAQLVARRAD